MVSLFKQIIKLFVTLVGFLFVGCLPALFHGVSINLNRYLSQISQVLSLFFRPDQMEYSYYGKVYPLFPDILEPYYYSFKVLFVSLICSFIVALVAIIATFSFPHWLRQIILTITFILESLPDLFIIVMFQVTVIWLFQGTGVLIMNVAESSNTQIYLMPILCLSILPTCFYYKAMTIAVKEQLEMDYVDLAKSKGMQSYEILLGHVLRNIAVPTLSYSKTIVWISLSNLVILEYMFGMHGLMKFIYDHPTPLVFTVSLFLIGIPLFGLYTLLSILIEKAIGKKVAI